MVGLIFGIIVLIAGIVVGVVLGIRKEESYREDVHGNYVRDNNGNRISDIKCPTKNTRGLQ